MVVVLRHDAIAFYYANSIGGNYDDTFGDKVTLESGIDAGRDAGRGDKRGMRVGMEFGVGTFPKNEWRGRRRRRQGGGGG